MCTNTVHMTNISHSNTSTDSLSFFHSLVFAPLTITHLLSFSLTGSHFHSLSLITHSLTRPLAHSLSLTHSLDCPRACLLLACSLDYLMANSLDYSRACLLTRLLAHTLACTHTRLISRALACSLDWIVTHISHTRLYLFACPGFTHVSNACPMPVCVCVYITFHCWVS